MVEPVAEVVDTAVQKVSFLRKVISWGKNNLLGIAGVATYAGLEASDAKSGEEAVGKAAGGVVTGSGALAGAKMGAKMGTGKMGTGLKRRLFFGTIGMFVGEEGVKAFSDKADQWGRWLTDKAGLSDTSAATPPTAEDLRLPPEERLKKAMESPALRLALLDYFEDKAFSVTLLNGNRVTMVPQHSTRPRPGETINGETINRENLGEFVGDKLSRDKDKVSDKHAREGIVALGLLEGIPEEDIRKEVNKMSGGSRIWYRATENISSLIDNLPVFKENRQLREELEKMKKDAGKLDTSSIEGSDAITSGLLSSIDGSPAKTSSKGPA